MSLTPEVVRLEQGRDAYARKAWSDAFESLSLADEEAPLGAEDLVFLAESAFMLGRDGEFLGILERAHHAYLDAGESLRAVRCAFWIGMNLALRGEMGPAGGWLGRAQRLLDREERDCVERGYMLLPASFQREGAGDHSGAAALAGQAAEIGEHFGDRDLFALALHQQGFMLIRHGEVKNGLDLMDEAMVAVTARELSPIVAGVVYCGVILASRRCTKCGARRSGRRLSPGGAPSSPISSPSRAAASCIARRSSSSRASGGMRWRRRAEPVRDLPGS